MSSERHPTVADLASGTWRLDPEGSEVGFAVPHFWGLIKVKGRFEVHEGRLDLTSRPAILLTLDATSLDTGNAKRDKHLRSADFFDVEHHPQVVFTSGSAVLDGEVLKVRGELEAAGRLVPLTLDARLTASGGGALELHAETEVDHRDLGMTWSPLGMLRAPSGLVVRGRLVRDVEAPAAGD